MKIYSKTIISTILRLRNIKIIFILKIKMEGGIIMPQTIDSLLLEYLSAVQKIYGSHLKSVILYGSYARGDYTAESDVDIMILVDLNEDEMEQYADALSELGFEYNVNHDIWIMPVVKNIEHFHYWATAYPFYKNVQKEGVTLYEAA